MAVSIYYVGIENGDFGYGGYNPSELYSVNLFGDWAPRAELARFADCGAHDIPGPPGTRNFSAQINAPTEPGFYRLRLLVHLGYDGPPSSFYNCKNGLAYSDVGFFVLDDSLMADWKNAFGEVSSATSSATTPPSQ